MTTWTAEQVSKRARQLRQRRNEMLHGGDGDISDMLDAFAASLDAPALTREQAEQKLTKDVVVSAFIAASSTDAIRELLDALFGPPVPTDQTRPREIAILDDDGRQTAMKRVGRYEIRTP